MKSLQEHAVDLLKALKADGYSADSVLIVTGDDGDTEACLLLDETQDLIPFLKSVATQLAGVIANGPHEGPTPIVVSDKTSSSN